MRSQARPPEDLAGDPEVFAAFSSWAQLPPLPESLPGQGPGCRLGILPMKTSPTRSHLPASALALADGWHLPRRGWEGG